MRVIIDFTQIPLDRTGVGVYGDHLIANLKTFLRDDDTLILIVQSDDLIVQEAVKDCLQISLLKIPSSLFRNRALLMIFEQLILPLIAWSKRANLIHSLHYTHPLFALTPRVVTIHDLTHSLFPELHTRGRRWLNPFFIRHAMKHARAVIFVSKATQADAEREFPAGRTLRCVAPLGVAPFPPALDGGNASKAALLSMGINGPYLLFIGTIEPRKNIIRIVQAFEHVAEHNPGLTLVLAGKLGWHTGEIVAAIENSPAYSHIIYLGFIGEIEKLTLLRNCAMLVYPSLYEGFGLPILEAMAIGAPVITSNISSMPEVAGDAALLVNPTSVEAIGAAIEKILSNEPLATHLRTAGHAQAASFTWNRTAELTFKTYQSALSSRSPY